MADGAHNPAAPQVRHAQEQGMYSNGTDPSGQLAASGTTYSYPHPLSAYTFEKKTANPGKRYKQFDYKSWMSQNMSEFIPLQRNSRGRGIVHIIINEKHLIPGIRKDICALETLYKDLKNYVVTGGHCDRNSDDKRDLDERGILHHINCLNKSYDPQFRVSGAEYDRIIVHIFAPGSADYICTPSGGYVRKTHLFNAIAQNLPNLQKQIPVVVTIHSSEPLPHRATLPAAPPDIVITDTSPNVLRFSTHQPKLDGYNADDGGSWFVQQMVKELQSSDDVQSAFENVNTKAQQKKLEITPIEFNCFKVLRLSYPIVPSVVLQRANAAEAAQPHWS